MLWRPFLLGPIFAAQGWTTSPFNLFPDKGRYMWRDMEREAARLAASLLPAQPFRRTACWPRASPSSARTRLGAGLHARRLHGRIRRGAGDRRPAVIADILDGLGLDGRGPRRRGRDGGQQDAPEAIGEEASCAASSAPRPSSPRMARCSGATTAWSRHSPGHATPRTNVPV